jgi:RES domain-containing protein
LPYEPLDLSVATIFVPDDASVEQIGVRRLPRDWSRFPSPSRLADLGTDWARRNKSLLLRVPSAVVDDEFNVIINPAHPEMSAVRIRDVRPYAFDERLFRRSKREA